MEPRDATRGGVNLAAAPRERGRAGPLVIDKNIARDLGSRDRRSRAMVNKRTRQAVEEQLCNRERRSAGQGERAAGVGGARAAAAGGEVIDDDRDRGRGGGAGFRGIGGGNRGGGGRGQIELEL